MKRLILVAVAAAALAVGVILAVTKPWSDANDPQLSPATETEMASEAEDTAQSAPASHRIDVFYLSQEEVLPSGCESVSSVMTLQYWGVDIGIIDFIDGYLPMVDTPQYGYDDEMYGESPYEYFLGSPYSDSGIGCYAPVIKGALNDVLDDYGGDAFAVADLCGLSLQQLCENYISRDIPVILWATIEMQPIEREISWYLPDGSEFIWKSPEHCLVLVGYDENYYYFNDPMEDKDAAYPKGKVENAYAALGSQALAIVPEEY